MGKLEEQLYTNTDRKYYHGANKDKVIYSKYIKPTALFESEDEIPMTWITTNVLYAMDYVGYNSRNNEWNPNDRIFVLELVSPTNIFNVSQTTDRKKFVKYLHFKDIQLSEDSLWELFSKDWSKLSTFKRSKLQHIIKNLGYEGLFNYENGYQNKYAPSVGLFDYQKAEIIEEVHPRDFEIRFAKQIQKGNERAKRILKEQGYYHPDLAKLAKVSEKMLIGAFIDECVYEDDYLD
jgi:hypothetical protein